MFLVRHPTALPWRARQAEQLKVPPERLRNNSHHRRVAALGVHARSVVPRLEVRVRRL